MNYKKLLLAATAIVCLLSAQEIKAQGCNQVRNPSFQDGPAVLGTIVANGGVDYWTGGSGGTVTNSLADKKVTLHGKYPTGYNVIRQQFSSGCQAVHAGSNYTFSIEAARTPVATSGRLIVYLRAVAGGAPAQLIFDQNIISTTAQTYTASFTATSNFYYIELQTYYNPSDPNDVFEVEIDNVSITEDAPSVPGTSYLVSLPCCQSNMLTFPGTLVGGDTPYYEWIDLETGNVIGNNPSVSIVPEKSGSSYVFKQYGPNCIGNNCLISCDTVVVKCCGGDDDWEFSDPTRITSADQIHRTGDVNIGNIAIVPGAPDIAKVEIKNNDNGKWGEFILNGGGSGRLLRLKGGYGGGTQSLFQVEANGATDYTEDNVRFMVRVDGRVGINTTTPQGALDVSGTTFCTSGFWTGSDRRYKENIEQIADPLSLVAKINGYRYDFRRNEFPQNNFREGKQIGFIAQELQQVVPEAVNTGENGYLAVNYNMVVPLLTEAVKDLKKEVDALRKELAQLQGTNIKGGNDEGIPGAILYQNVPNPFNSNTEIAYELPENVKNASIDIYDMTGKTLHSTPVKAGKNSISVIANELAPGMYLYSLQCDGKVVNTKRMVITK